MISIEDRKQFARAESKAREIKPRVKMIKFGQYEVAGSEGGVYEGGVYTVEFDNDNGHWQAACNCLGHTAKRAPQPCYHIVAAYASHRIQAKIRKEVRAALVTVPAPAIAPAPALQFCGCGAELTQGEWCEVCQAAFDRKCLFG